MRLLVLGAPGAGKGTQAKMIAKKYKIPHISTGDIFRENIKKETKLGKRVTKILDKGELVPDELTNEIVKDRLKKDDCKSGFVLDGYPRTIPQAEYLEKLLNNFGVELDCVINILSTDETIVKRISGRRICPKCNADYHIIYDPPKEDMKCDKCKTQLIQRKDDKEETVLDRIKVYKKQTEPLIQYYKNKDSLVDIDGERRPKEIFSDIVDLIG